MTTPRNIVASVLARLRNVATDSDLSFNDTLQAYVIERFSARIARSAQADTVLLFGSSHLNEETVRNADLSLPIILAEIAPGRFNVEDLSPVKAPRKHRKRMS